MEGEESTLSYTLKWWWHYFTSDMSMDGSTALWIIFIVYYIASFSALVNNGVPWPLALILAPFTLIAFVVFLVFWFLVGWWVA